MHLLSANYTDKTRLKPVMGILLAALSFSGVAANKAAPMDKLNWLIGEWTFADEQVNGSYWEKGTRNCFKILHDQYIRYNGKDQYIWHIRNGEQDPQTGKRAVGFIDTVTRAKN